MYGSFPGRAWELRIAPAMRLIIDAHLDLALNALNYDRDLRLVARRR